jgi:hypothetical protein
MADNERAIGYVTQSGQGVAGTVSAPMYGVRQYTTPSAVKTDAPHYLTNRAFNQGSIRYQTREGRLRIEGDVSPANLLPLLEAGAGPASTGVVLFGVGTRKFLTVKWAEGLAQYWQAIDQIVNTLELNYTIDNGWQFTAELVGPQATVTASAWATVAPAPTDLTPFSSWQVVIKRGATFECVRRFRLALNNNAEAQYCSPSADPTAGQLAGLSPTRYVFGDGEVAVEFEAQYTANAGSEYEGFQQQAVRTDWTLEATDPNATADVLVEILRAGYTEGEIMRERTNWEHITGLALLDNTAGAPVRITVTA